MKELVARLEAHDVDVPGLQRWHELTEFARINRQPEPEPPADILGQTVEQTAAWVDDRALYEARHTKPGKLHLPPQMTALAQLQKRLDPALKERIRKNAVSIIDQLRPEFDQAARMMRHARALGVDPRATITTLFHASDEMRNAWTAAKQAAPVLDGIFTTRQMLSTVADVPPTLDFEVGRARRVAFQDGRDTSGFNWTVTVVKPEVAGMVMEPINHDAPWERWLAIAPHLELSYPGEEKNDRTTFERQSGMTVEQAVAVAKAQGETAAAEVAALNA
ncbi:hypothetical protein [Arthrobacter zhaoguopingii]|uniref:hypothetical protein n=1 Tax=Arthrobacter zhaoguopingii TaxID=2681491 RepID=UPI00135ADD17|nr:hypothetical protein [Arthrobacter zhaoguopingii]